ncbi:hypothetical protein [Rhizohabitans arisaemae]|uniref:hypothetical protein n=1 Tax=Rhizohabitans arisaemae TaxID=2720610 RepID=UPI0024B15636|nr:hypothetical protein [Rhizohabitans arisaemae]
MEILLDGRTDPEVTEVGDSTVTLPDGRRYSAYLMTREELSRIMDRHLVTGESLNGSYFCATDLVVVRNRGVTAMIDVVRDIVETEDIGNLLPRIADDGTRENPTM